MNLKPAVKILAFSAIAFAVLMPPEAYPAGKMAVLICSSFAFLACLSENKIPRNYLIAGISTFLLLLMHSLWISVDPYRSTEFLTVLWAYYCLGGYFLYSGELLLEQTAAVIIGVSVIVSGYGLYQYFWGFDNVYQYIFYSGSDQVIKVPALERIATRRVFSTLALPGTLWGFLVIALPFHAIVLQRRKWGNALILLDRKSTRLNSSH